VASLQVDCVTRTGQGGPDEAILGVGGRNPDGTRWKISAKDAIRHIENQELHFYVSVNGQKVFLVVASRRSGGQYLKSEADGDEPAGLLGLPECPG